MAESEKDERGPKTPGLALGPTIELLRKVREGVGLSRASRETVARALGYGSLNGRSNRAIAALVHFGLLERSAAAAVQVSPLGKQILMPHSDAEARGAQAEAARQPAVYRKLFDRYAGHALPTLLANILVREFGVVPNSSEEVAKIFRESVEFAGLLRNGVLYEHLDDESINSSGEAPVQIERDTADSTGAGARGDGSGAEVPMKAPAGTQGYTIPLDRQGRVATIYIPLPVLPTDLKRIGRWATFMSEMADDEVEDVISS